MDPFSGSGTVCAVAKRLGRHWLGFEINPKWHAVSLDRLAGVTQREKEKGITQLKLW